MASLLRQIVSGPRARHPEAGLDLCYVTNHIIATSGPSGTYPQLAYRTPLKQLVKFLDEKHDDQWAIWEFRAEGTGYPDSEVYDRIYHYPWPDHHPPPFALIPLIMGSMRNWLKGEASSDQEGHSVVLMEGQQTDQTRDTNIEQSGSSELTEKLEAVRLEQSSTQASATMHGEAQPSTATGESAPGAPQDPPDGKARPMLSVFTNGTADSSPLPSPALSDTSTRSSARKRKEVRWRESTLLPPKELRVSKPGSPDPDVGKTGDKKDKDKKRKDDVDKDDKRKDPPASKSRSLLSRRRPDAKADLDGKAAAKSSKHDVEADQDSGISRSRPGPASSAKKERVVVVHCKAGKGRSGTVSCSYLISQECWSMADALARFTERRMRPGFGAGVSIPSQLRWISYVDRWTKHGKRYFERGVEIVEVHAWGLRDRVKVSIEGYAEEGRRIELVHAFTKEERDTVREEKPGKGVVASMGEMVGQERDKRRRGKNEILNGSAAASSASIEQVKDEGVRRSKTSMNDLKSEDGGGDVIFRPKNRIRTQTGDVNIDFERRNKGVSGLTMITSVAHVWFNAFFEGDGPEREGRPLTSGVFEMEWDKMDGLKGSSRKGTRAFDRVAIVWRVEEDGPEKVGTEIREPAEGEGVKDIKPADWRGGHDKDADRELADETDSIASGPTNGDSHPPSEVPSEIPPENEAVAYGSEGKEAILKD